MTQPPITIVKQLRALMPMRPLTLSDAYALAELQANKTVALLGVRPLQAVDLGWITHLPRVRVVPRPRHEMPNLSGFTQWENGAYLVVINGSDGRNRRRFTLAHEFKHVIDMASRKLIYAQLGQGDKGEHDKHGDTRANQSAARLRLPERFGLQAR